MKRIAAFLLCVLMCLTLASCGGNKVSAGIEYNFETDDQYYLGSSGQRLIAEGPDAFYFYNDADNGSFLYYMDKKTHEIYPLCSLAYCRHDEETYAQKRYECYAYCIFPIGLSYYSGKLYASALTLGELSYETTVKEYSLDGVLLRDVAVLPSSSGSLTQHRGYIYYSYSELPEDAAENDWGTIFFAKLSLKTGKSEVIEQWTTDECNGIGNFMAYGDRLYYLQSYYSEEGNWANRIGIYNLNTGETNYLYCHDENNSICHPMIYKDKLIYNEFKEDLDGEPDYYVTEQYLQEGVQLTDENASRVVYTAGLDGSNPKKLTEMEYMNGVELAYDDVILNTSRFYMFYGVSEGEDYEPHQDIAVYKNLKLVGHFDLSDVEGHDFSGHEYAVASDCGDYLVFMTYGLCEEYGGRTWIMVEKSQLETCENVTPKIMCMPKTGVEVVFG